MWSKAKKHRSSKRYFEEMVANIHKEACDPPPNDNVDYPVATTSTDSGAGHQNLVDTYTCNFFNGMLQLGFIA